MKYTHTFQSKNDDQQFTLTFRVNGGKRMHVVSDVQVYQHRSDMFCELTRHDNGARHSFSVKSINDGSKFGIDLYVTPTGCEVIVVETVLETISHNHLQPCNTTDIA